MHEALNMTNANALKWSMGGEGVLGALEQAVETKWVETAEKD